ncbi:hypothetical protein PM082_022442 [Marasmius tenuissimus]|nr:hypothetical protein PM082_022442 [Marasmius tenuissimus]
MPILLTEASVLAIAEEVSTIYSTKGGILTKLFVMGAIIPVTMVSVKEWFYPKRRRMIKIREWVTAEPKRRNLFGWIGFGWREMGEVRECYCSVMDLKQDVMVRT